MNLQHIKFTSIDTIDVFTPHFGSYKYQLDEIQKFGISNGQTNTELVGAYGSIIGMLKKAPTNKVTFTSGVVSAGLMSDEYGTEIIEGTQTIEWNDVVTITKNVATLSFVPVRGIQKVYVNGTAYDLTSTESDAPEAGKTVKYTQGETSAVNGTITFAEGEYLDGTEVAIKYERNVSAVSLDRRSDKVSEDIALIATGQWEDECNVVRKWQCKIPVVSPTGTFDVEIGENQTTEPFEGTVKSTKCNGSKTMLKWLFFDGNADDVVTTA